MPNEHRIGLIVNPVAGMGGSVGLKGTDGDAYEKALALGATPVSPGRIHEVLIHIARGDDIRWLAAPGAMGADHIRAAGRECEVVGTIGPRSTATDTRDIATLMLEAGAELIVFAGGDGTARDIADAIGTRMPVVAVPAGVKIYSSVFAVSPLAAARIIDAFIDGAGLTEEEVLDIDEDAFREGRLDARHYGFLLVPETGPLLQAGKESSGMTGAVAEIKQEIAATVVEQMAPGTLYLLGGGTTIRAIADELGLDKTLLGVDAVLDGRLVGSDLNEQGILALLAQHADAKIVLTPLGGNGFIFGRGNKQFTPEVIRRVGRDNVIVVANREKLLGLGCLRVDTGDAALDEELSGYVDVIVGLNHTKIIRVR